MILSLSMLGAEAQSLPDAFTLFSGEKVKTKNDWYTKRQPEIIRFFESEVYGKIPSTADFKFHFQILEEETKILNGKGYRKQVRMFIRNNQDDTISVDFLIYYPVAAKKEPVPVFALLNYGNHTLSDDTLIQISVSKLYSADQQRGSYMVILYRTMIHFSEKQVNVFMAFLLNLQERFLSGPGGILK
jgi:hypothetical protein